MMFVVRAGNEREHNENNKALLAWRKNKHRQQPFHFIA
jgi:hypothetical protein